VIDLDALDTVEAEYREVGQRFPSLSARYVPGEGDNPEAFIIGEAPGAEESIQLRPFVGKAGKVLRELMLLAGLHINEVTGFDVTRKQFAANCWLTNVCKFRPPAKREPTGYEIKAFRPILFSEWLAVGAPKLIIPVGKTALWAVTGKRTSILRAAGKCHYYTTKDRKTMVVWPMVHPSFGLRNPAAQPLLEQDWEALGEWRKKNAIG
jgi:uracil-DNA glycosylase family 4